MSDKLPIFKVNGSEKNSITFQPFQTGDLVYEFGYYGKKGFAKKEEMNKWWNAIENQTMKKTNYPKRGLNPRTGEMNFWTLGKIERTNLPEGGAAGGAGGAGGGNSTNEHIEELSKNKEKLYENLNIHVRERLEQRLEQERLEQERLEQLRRKPEVYYFDLDMDTEENIAKAFHVQNVKRVRDEDVSDYEDKRVIGFLGREAGQYKYAIGFFLYDSHTGNGKIEINSGEEFDIDVDSRPVIYSFDEIAEGGGKHRGKGKKASRRLSKTLKRKQKKTKRRRS